MKTIELLSIDLNNYIPLYNTEGFAVLSINDNEYLIFSILYRRYGFVYDCNDRTTYPEILAKVNYNTIEEIEINNVGIIFDLQTPIDEIKKFYIEYLISFGYVLKS